MAWLRRHSWWGLFGVTALLVAFGVTDVIVGPAADRAIPLALTGMTIEALEAESPVVYRLFDFFTRVNGFSLMLVGLLGTAILLFAFRRDRRWAWWTMWLLPAWAIGAAAFYLVAGIDPDQPPPPPLISGPIIAVLCSAILLVSAPRFFGRSQGGSE